MCLLFVVGFVIGFGLSLIVVCVHCCHFRWRMIKIDNVLKKLFTIFLEFKQTVLTKNINSYILLAPVLLKAPLLLLLALLLLLMLLLLLLLLLLTGGGRGQGR